MKLEKLAAFGIAAIALMGCKSEEPAQQGGYPQQTQPAGVGQPPTQPGYAQPAATAPAATTPHPVVTQPAATAPAAGTPALSTPGPTATACTSDAMCLTAKCNTQFGKCVFPCQNDNDCIAPNHCAATLIGMACVPAMPGQ